MEELWLYEAITGTYLPLLQIFEGLVTDGVPYRCTVSLSAPLISMLTDDLLKTRYARAPRQAHRARREGARAHAPGAALPPARADVLRPLPLAAPHVALPRRQPGARVPAAAGGRAARGHHLHRHPRLLPAHRPQLGGHPRPGPRGRRPLRAALRPAGRAACGWANAATCRASTSSCARRRSATSSSTPTAPLRRPAPGLRGVRARSTAARASPPSPATSSPRVQVWSAKEGYPGDPHYRDFYRDIGFDLPMDYIAPVHPPRGAPHLHRDQVPRDHPRASCTTSGSTTPSIARRRAGEHAAHFRGNRAEQVEHLAAHMDRPPIIVSPYDAELYGHWWYEGPQFLDDLFRQLHYDQDVVETDHARRLPRAPPHQPGRDAVRLVLGQGGYSEYWLNESNAWIYRHLHAAAERMVELARRFPSRGRPDRARPQPGRARADARPEQRLGVHHDDGHDGALRRAPLQRAHPALQPALRRALGGATERGAGSRDVECQDNIFPDVDYRIYAT